MNSSRLKIENRNGNVLNAYLELPANQKPDYYAIFAHCFTSVSYTHLTLPTNREV